jgi:hypothetical protein
MSHTIKLCDMIIEHRLMRVTNVTENQFDFMIGRLTIRQFIERCRE